MTGQPTPRTCTSCRGDGGKTVKTTSGSVTHETWKRCAPCRGTGVTGGGR